MKNGPLLSVIIPVYNAQKYLNHCIESVLNQTYRNTELILVDDGSTDNSFALCNEWKKQDDRVKVYHKENGGQASARNFGLRKSGGHMLLSWMMMIG